MTTTTTELMKLAAVTKVFGEGEARVVALRGIDLTIRRGDFVAILGASARCGRRRGPRLGGRKKTHLGLARRQFRRRPAG